MGRRKICIQKIEDERLKNITFNKRKNGLIKKAAELSMLCDVKCVLIFNDLNDKLIKFTSADPQNVFDFFQKFNQTNIFEFTCTDYPEFFKVNHYKKRDSENISKIADDDDDEEVDNNFQEETEEAEEKSTLNKNPRIEQEVTNKKKRVSQRTIMTRSKQNLLAKTQKKTKSKTKQLKWQKQLTKNIENIHESVSSQSLNDKKDNKIVNNKLEMEKFQQELSIIRSLSETGCNKNDFESSKQNSIHDNGLNNEKKYILKNKELTGSQIMEIPYNLQNSNSNMIGQVTQQTNQMKSISQLIQPQLINLQNIMQQQQQNQHSNIFNEDLMSSQKYDLNLSGIVGLGGDLNNMKNYQDFKNYQNSIYYKQQSNNNNIGYNMNQESITLKNLQDSLTGMITQKGLGDSFGYKNYLDINNSSMRLLDNFNESIKHYNNINNSINTTTIPLSSNHDKKPELYDSFRRTQSFTKNQNFCVSPTLKPQQQQSSNNNNNNNNNNSNLNPPVNKLFSLFNNLDSSIPFTTTNDNINIQISNTNNYNNTINSSILKKISPPVTKKGEHELLHKPNYSINHPNTPRTEEIVGDFDSLLQMINSEQRKNTQDNISSPGLNTQNKNSKIAEIHQN